MEYEFEKRLTEDLESMQVTDLVDKARDYVYFCVCTEDKEPILPILTGDKKILTTKDIMENDRYRHLLSRFTVKKFESFMDVVIVYVDHTYEEAKELLTDD